MADWPKSMAKFGPFVFRIPWIIISLIICAEVIHCSTHWVVTEDGKVQAQMDSVFSLRHPYDLVALIQQEQRALLVDELKEQLITRKEEIDRNEDKETNLEEKLYVTDADCMAAGKPLTEFDLYLSTVVPLDVKGLNANAFISSDVKAEDVEEYQKPYCTKIYDLEFSMHAFEHLLGIRERRNLNISAEEGLSNAVTHIEKVDLFGHLVYESLKQNKTSWVLYNLAAYYWRMKGDANNAIECLRRALHFSPREYKDVSLISLGNILHRANYCEEAAVVVHAAIDISPDNAICHFTLGNIYAVLSDYNKSVVCFENTLKLQSNSKNAEQRLRAVRCLSKLEKALEAHHNSLQRTLAELHEYQQQQEYCLKQQEKLLSEQASAAMKFEQQLHYENYKIRQSWDGKGQDCFQFEQNGHTILSCNMRREAYHQGLQSHVDLSLNLQLIQAVEARVVKAGQKVLGAKMSRTASDHCQHT